MTAHTHTHDSTQLHSHRNTFGYLVSLLAAACINHAATNESNNDKAT
jgi:hypothetical protein